MSVTSVDIDRYEKEATAYYFLWFVVYLVLGLAAILLPAMAAIDIAPNLIGSKVLAALGAAAAATYGFLKPNDYVAAFDAAVAELRSLRHRLDVLPVEQRAERMDVILRLMAFKYQGDIAARNKV